MIDYNLHQHSTFSDGKAEPEAYVKKALELGFRAMGFTEHSPLPFPTTFSLKKENADAYVRETARLKEMYRGQIALYRALEFDFIPGLSDDFDSWRDKLHLDYAIGSVHLVRPEQSDDLWFIDGPEREKYDDGLRKYFGNDIKKAVKTYYFQINQMIETQQFEIVGHLDKIKMHNAGRYFSEEEKWYRRLVSETLELIKEKDLVVEVNTRGLYKKRSNRLFPDDETLKQISTMQIPVLISSDAHQPDELNTFMNYAEKRLVETGIKSVVFFREGSWQDVSLV
ncbi:MAG: histidinol-phosphatase [bacterium]|nr:MAG: histidinol-phosphatase [bacterium]